MDSRDLVESLDNLSIGKDANKNIKDTRKRLRPKKHKERKREQEGQVNNLTDDVKDDKDDKVDRTRKSVKEKRSKKERNRTTTLSTPFDQTNDRHATFPQPLKLPQPGPPQLGQRHPDWLPPLSSSPAHPHPSTFFNSGLRPNALQDGASHPDPIPTQNAPIRYVPSAPTQQGSSLPRRSSRIASKAQIDSKFFDPSLVVGYVQSTTAETNPNFHPVRTLRPSNSPSSQKLPRTLTKPIPTFSYFTSAKLPPKRLDSPRSLLVVLDLNGVLVHRSKASRRAFVPRPGLIDFLDYLFAHHSVMIWSSGMPENVVRIVERAFAQHHHQKLVAVWSRDTLRLPEHLYRDKIQVYKQLSWLWEDEELRKKAIQAGVNEGWSQANTVLIDDAVEKAVAEPYNLIEVNDFTNAKDQQNDGTLADVVNYLESIRWFDNCSAAMRQNPFVVKP